LLFLKAGVKRYGLAMLVDLKIVCQERLLIEKAIEESCEQIHRDDWK